MAITPQQVKVYMSARNTGDTPVSAAAKAAVSTRTGRRIESGARRLPPSPPPWRTRQDPFEGDPVLRPLLEAYPQWQAITLLEELQARYPGQYPDYLLRTLPRRVKAWRALHGPAKEVIFRQTHPPGAWGLSDFTVLKDRVVTVGGEPLAHRLYPFRLADSGGCDVKVILGGESFTALAEGLTRALQRLGGAPAEHRTDRLSAAFKHLSREAQEAITRRYQALCAHYGRDARRNPPGGAHENGAIESPHGHLKRRIERTLQRRGSTDFARVAASQDWLDSMTAAAAPARAYRRRARAPPPGGRYTELFVRVTRSSPLNVRLVVYSVPARLLGERLRVPLYDDRLLCYAGTALALTLPRVYPKPGKRRARCIDYRPVISSRVKKPRAFYPSQLRDERLPSARWHRIWQQLLTRLDARSACKLRVGCLQRAASHDCEQALGAHLLRYRSMGALEQGQRPPLLQQRFGRPLHRAPAPAVEQHPLAAYDALLGGCSAEGAHA